jgi:inosine-uridine nucleoside N-ribohydrolase
MGQGKPRKEGSPIPGVSVNYTNHNISADTAAAMCVFQAPFPEIVLINDAVTNRCWFQGMATRALLRWGLDCPAGSRDASAIVGRLLGCWFEYRSMLFHRKIRGTCPHDGLALAETLHPGEFVQYQRGRMLITEWAGFTCFVRDSSAAGRVFVGESVNRDGFLVHFTNVILAHPPLSQIALDSRALVDMSDGEQQDSE